MSLAIGRECSVALGFGALSGQADRCSPAQAPEPSIRDTGGRPGDGERRQTDRSRNRDRHREKEKERVSRLTQQPNSHHPLERGGDGILGAPRLRNPGNLNKEIEENSICH